MERFMNKELEKKFDEELFELGGNVLDYEGNIRPKQHLPLDAIKSFIDKHFIAKEGIKGLGKAIVEDEIESQMKDLYTKAELLDMVGEDMKRQFPLAEKPDDRIFDCDVVAYNQAKAEIRDRINGRI